MLRRWDNVFWATTLRHHYDVYAVYLVYVSKTFHKVANKLFFIFVK